MRNRIVALVPALALAAFAATLAPAVSAQICPEPPVVYAQTGFYTRLDVWGERMLGWDLELRRLGVLDIAAGPPALLGTWPAEDVEDVAVEGSLGAVVDGVSLRLLDLANPAVPVEVGTLPTLGFFVDVDLAAGLAAVHDLEFAEVVLVDVTDPTAPAIAGRYPVSGLRDLALWQDVLFLALDQGLALVDVGEPAAPSPIVERGDLGPFPAIAAAEGFLFAHDLEFATVALFDVAAPPEVRLLGSWPAGEPRDVAVFPCRAWVAQAAVGRSGLEALGIADCAGCAARCVEDGRTLCLGQRRFRVRATWRTPAGDSGAAGARTLTADTGTFWFFDPDNVEVVVKVLDACVPFDRHWVFLAGLTNVEVTIAVEDLAADASRTYRNPLGRPFPPTLDTAAFDTCP